MLKKARQEKHGGHPTILSQWYASEEYSKSLYDIGWREYHIISYDKIAVENTPTKLRRLKEFRFRKMGFLQQMLLEELSSHSINDPTLLKRKENANDCMSSTWQEPNRNTEIIWRQRRMNATTPLTRKQVGGSTDSREETCRHLSSLGSRANLNEASSSSSTWD